MKMVPSLTRTRFMKRAEELEDWSDDSGRIVLIGEAAHPWFVSKLCFSSLLSSFLCPSVKAVLMLVLHISPEDLILPVW